jgi:hypothetical protein
MYKIDTEINPTNTYTNYTHTKFAHTKQGLYQKLHTRINSNSNKESFITSLHKQDRLFFKFKQPQDPTNYPKYNPNLSHLTRPYPGHHRGSHLTEQPNITPTMPQDNTTKPSATAAEAINLFTSATKQSNAMSMAKKASPHAKLPTTTEASTTKPRAMAKTEQDATPAKPETVLDPFDQAPDTKVTNKQAPSLCAKLLASVKSFNNTPAAASIPRASKALDLKSPPPYPQEPMTAHVWVTAMIDTSSEVFR